MSSEVDVMALAAQGANVLVTEMARGGWQVVRDAFARFLRRDGQATATRHLEMLDEAEHGLAGASEADRGRIEQRLVRLFAAYLDRFPDMAEELRSALFSGGQAPQGPWPPMSASHNTNSQILQAVGDIDAGEGGINYGVPPRSGR